MYSTAREDLEDRADELVVPTDDDHGASSWNRDHHEAAARLDRATGGSLRGEDGTLDVAAVIAWQRAHLIAATGRADAETCDVAEGKPWHRQQPAATCEVRLMTPCEGELVEDTAVVV